MTIDKGLQSVLDYLKGEQNLILVYTENNGVRTYSQIGSLVPDREKGEFMRLYTSVAKNASSGSDVKTFTYKNVELKEAAVGVTGLTIEKDCVIALKLDVLKGNDPVDVKEGTMTLVIGDDDYIIDLSKVEITSGADSILDYLKENENVTLEYTVSDYGRYYSKVGSLVPDSSKNEYISIYTSVEANKGTWDGAKTLTIGETVLGEASVGSSSLTIEKDCVIAFVIDSY